MGEVGFDGARCVGKGEFWTSHTTRTMDFVATKSLPTVFPKSVVAKSEKSSGLTKALVLAGVAALLAFTVSKVMARR